MTRRNNVMSIFLSLFSRPLLPGQWLKRLQTPLLCMVIVLSQSSLIVYAADMSAPASQDCEINSGPCSRKIGGAYVILDIVPKPVKAMKELTFTVTLKGTGEYKSLKLKLLMPGMFMGNNEVKLVSVGGGKYIGTGVIPKCHSGKKVWSAMVEVPGVTPLETSFLFNVLY